MQLTLDVLGQVIPIRRMNERARRIHGDIDGGKAVAFAGFVCYRPQPLIPHLVPETVRETERQVA